jgi:hypothetical protein
VFIGRDVWPRVGVCAQRQLIPGAGNLDLSVSARHGDAAAGGGNRLGTGGTDSEEEDLVAQEDEDLKLAIARSLQDSCAKRVVGKIQGVLPCVLVTSTHLS